MPNKHRATARGKLTTMTTTDTRAALDAATLALIEAAADEGRAWGLHSLPTGDDSTYADYSWANEARGNAEDDIKAAITAHVEAEVARRLAVADSVDEAIERLRAAIAADRERAVREATEPRITASTGVVPVVADAEGRMLGGRREGLDTIYDQVKVPVARDKARPTPDEARRLVGEFAGAHGAMVAHLAGMIGPESGEDVAARTESARAALLRALGVEA